MHLETSVEFGGHMLSARVRMHVEWLVPLGQTRPITNALQSLAAATRPTRGCAGCSVMAVIGNPGTVRYTEEWLTEQDLRNRVRSDDFTQLVTLIEDAMHAPRVEFVLPHGTRGLDFVREVRVVSG